MAIKVAPGTAEQMCRYGDPGYLSGLFVLQARDPDDVEAALVAMGRVASYMSDLGASMATLPAPTPDGPVIAVDGKDIASSLLPQIFETITRHLEDAGVRRAVIAVAEGGGGFMEGLPRPEVVVNLYLYPPPPRWGTSERSRLPAGWADKAWAMFGAEAADDTVLWGGVTFAPGLSVRAGDGLGLFSKWESLNVSGRLAYQGGGQRVWSIDGPFSDPEHCLGLAVGGQAGDAELAGRRSGPNGQRVGPSRTPTSTPTTGVG